jgi:HEAT repeat protein
MTSSKPNIQALGLAWQISDNNAEALNQASTQLSPFQDSLLRTMLTLSIRSYSGTDPLGVRGLGSMITNGSPPLREAASAALRDIHTAATLPYLTQSLDSADANVRQNAIAGLSFYILGAPVLNDKNRAVEFDRALNPATKRRLSPDEEAHVHFGQIEQPGREPDLTLWWKQWSKRGGVDAP